MPTVQMNLTLPDTTTRGPDYVALNNDAFLAIDGHDHTTGRGARLPTAALDINTDLPLNEHKLVDALGVSLLQLGAPLTDPTDVATLYCVAGDLYYNNEDGFAVQVTSGNSINAASVAGIGGDYSGSAAQVTYTDATKNYLFTSAPGVRANLQASTLELTHPTLAKVDMGNSQGAVRRHTLESAAYGFSLTDTTAGRVVVDYVSGAVGETDRLELMPANTAPVLVGSTLLQLAQTRLPLQLSTAAAGTDAYLGLNKNGAEGMAIGYANATTGAAGTLTGTGGVIRMLSTDPLLVAHQGAVTATWRGAGLTIGPEDGAGPQAALNIRSATAANMIIEGSATSAQAQLLLRAGATSSAWVNLGRSGSLYYLAGMDGTSTYYLRDVANLREVYRYDPVGNTFRISATPTVPSRQVVYYTSLLRARIETPLGASIEYRDGNYYLGESSSQVLNIPIALPESGTITTITVGRSVQGSGSVTYELRRRNPTTPDGGSAGTRPSVLVASLFVNSAGYVTDSITVNTAIDATSIYWIKASVSAGGAASSLRLFQLAANVTHDRLEGAIR